MEEHLPDCFRLPDPADVRRDHDGESRFRLAKALGRVFGRPGGVRVKRGLLEVHSVPVFDNLLHAFPVQPDQLSALGRG